MNFAKAAALSLTLLASVAWAQPSGGATGGRSAADECGAEGCV